MATILGFLGGMGVFCVWWSFWVRDEAGRREGRWSSNTRDTLVAAGLPGVTPAGLLCAAGAFGAVSSRRPASGRRASPGSEDHSDAMTAAEGGMGNGAAGGAASCPAARISAAAGRGPPSAAGVATGAGVVFLTAGSGIEASVAGGF